MILLIYSNGIAISQWFWCFLILSYFLIWKILKLNWLWEILWTKTAWLLPLHWWISWGYPSNCWRHIGRFLIHHMILVLSLDTYFINSLLVIYMIKQQNSANWNCYQYLRNFVIFMINVFHLLFLLLLHLQIKWYLDFAFLLTHWNPNPQALLITLSLIVSWKTIILHLHLLFPVLFHWNYPWT